MKTIKITIAALFSIALLFTSLSPPLYAADTGLLQCVTDCIMQEGEDESDTCQLRCAKLHIDMSQQPKDCMAVYKQCKKECKTNLTNCV